MSSDLLLEQIKELLITSIGRGELQLDKITKLVSNLKRREVYERLRILTENFKLYHDTEKLNQFF